MRSTRTVQGKVGCAAKGREERSVEATTTRLCERHRKPTRMRETVHTTIVASFVRPGQPVPPPREVNPIPMG